MPAICLDSPYGTNRKDSRGTINQPTLLTFASNSALSIYFFSLLSCTRKYGLYDNTVLHYWAQACYSSSCCCFFFCWFRVRVSSLESEISLLLTRMSHRRTDHWFALLGCDLLLPLLLLFLLLLLFVAVVILLMIQKTPSLLLVDGRYTGKERSEIGIYSEESRSAEGCRRYGVITQVHKAACTGA